MMLVGIMPKLQLKKNWLFGMKFVHSTKKKRLHDEGFLLGNLATNSKVSLMPIFNFEEQRRDEVVQ